jgi:hypothetical protein
MELLGRRRLGLVGFDNSTSLCSNSLFHSFFDFNYLEPAFLKF